MMSLTVDGPELQLEAAHLLDLVRQVLHENLQLGSLVLEVREFITGGSGDLLVRGLEALRGISQTTLKVK